MERFTTTTLRPVRIATKSVGEKILHDRLHLIQHGKKPIVRVDGNFTSKKVHPGSAAWAASSLFFLCAILFVWLFYTKAWSPEKKEYHYEQVLSNEYEYEPKSGGFSLLKSSQTFINIFRMDNSKKDREKRLDSLSTVNLMVPINEADEDSEEYETWRKLGIPLGIIPGCIIRDVSRGIKGWWKWGFPRTTGNELYLPIVCFPEVTGKWMGWWKRRGTLSTYRLYGLVVCACMVILQYTNKWWQFTSLGMGSADKSPNVKSFSRYKGNCPIYFHDL